MRKETYIQFRITEEEKKKIQKKCRKIGIGISEYFRQLYVFGDVRNVPESVVVDLRRIGINVNQIAKRINAGAITKDQVIIELTALLDELKKLNIR